jgi:hypothetical protein
MLPEGETARATKDGSSAKPQATGMTIVRNMAIFRKATMDGILTPRRRRRAFAYC